MKLPEKIIMAGLAIGFVIVTICFLTLDIVSGKIIASKEAEIELYSLKDKCFDRLQSVDGIYSIYVTNDADKRTILIKWESYFMEQSYSMITVNPQSCQS